MPIVPALSKPTRRRLILHAGSPKTGSSALQSAFAREFERYKAAGILYPLEGRLSAAEPKHQWVARTLRDDCESDFASFMARVESACDEHTHTIVLSTEGLYNLWPLLRESARAWLPRRLAAYDVSWWLWLRDPAEFCRSYYVQSLWNPRAARRPEWGRDLSVSDFLELAEIVEKLDYRGTYRDIESVFGAGSVYGFAFARDSAARANDLLGRPFAAGPELRENVTVTTEVGVRLLRAINREPLDAAQKKAISEPLAAVIGTVGDRSDPFAITREEAARARAICTMTCEEIAEMDARSLSRWHARFSGEGTLTDGVARR